jgi:hypothetical protein
MEFYILKRSLSLGRNLYRFSSRGQNNQGTKCMRGQNHQDEMTGYEMKGDEV